MRIWHDKRHCIFGRRHSQFLVVDVVVHLRQIDIEAIN